MNSNLIAIAVIAGLVAGGASGQDYPNKPIRISAGNAGGGGDFTARTIAQGISGPLGQQMIVENRANLVSATHVSKAPPDGYTLLVIGASLWVNPLLRKMPFDAVQDFAPISLLVREVNLLAVHPSLPVKSVKELIALAKARPGVLNFASSGIGGTAHLAAELFKTTADVNMVHIPYTSTAPAVTALLSGESQLMIIDAGILLPHIKVGKLRGLAVTSAQPSPLFPTLPTIAASGAPGYETVNSTAMLAPAKTPEAIIGRLNQEIVRFLSRAEVKERYLNNGTEIVASSPDQLAAAIKTETARSAKIIKDAGIKTN